MGTLRAITIPTGRADDAEIERQAATVERFSLLRPVLDAMGEAVMVLNPERQIVFANRSLTALLGPGAPRSLSGLRPGEALRCVNATRTRGGCGGSGPCRSCGAVRAILAAQDGSSDVRDCHILTEAGRTAIDLRVRTAPLALAGDTFTLCTVTDIAHEKRRSTLERIFFHDVMSQAQGLRLLAGTLRQESEPRRVRSLAAALGDGLEQLLEEIGSQKDLAAAETGELAVHPAPLASLDLARDLLEQLGEEPGRRLVSLDPRSENVRFTSDRTLVLRVLYNMVRNAVEASGTGESVTVGTRRAGRFVELWVHNPAVIPEEVQHRVFRRAGSTKGPGRGLGTYGMKLLTEGYLGGCVSFASAPGSGTTFVAAYPLDPTAVGSGAT